MKFIYKLLIILIIIPFSVVTGQKTSISTVSDSLNLKSVLNEVIANFPSILKIEKELDAANARIGLANSAYYPDVVFNSSYSRIGPTSTISIPDMGSFKLFPADNYSLGLSVNQSIYDFGKTAKNIDIEKQGKDLTKLTIEQVKQGLSLRVVSIYYSLVYLQEAVKIKDNELANLQEHLRYVEKKAETGSATKYEILTTRVRISNIENQKTDILTSLQIQQSQLNTLLGQPLDSKKTVKVDLQGADIILADDSLFNMALENRDEMKIARQKTQMAKAKYALVGAQNNPTFSFFANGGLKNGYLPNLATLTPNYSVGVGLKVPLFDAMRTKYNKLQVKANMDENDQDTELAKRTILNEVVESKANSVSALKKVKQSDLQLQQAEQAYELAETNFEAGVITNLDLLQSFTQVAESKLALLKTKIDYNVSLLRLKLSLGARIY